MSRLSSSSHSSEDSQAEKAPAPHPRVSKCDRLAYIVDQLLSKRWSQCVALCCFGLVQVAIWGLIYAVVWEPQDGDPRDQEDVNRIAEGIWEAWTFMADPGTHSKDFGTDQRIVGALITVGGIIFFASILGVVVDVIREKMESLRQGRSNVIEKGHSLILGFTDKTILLIEELCIANESEKGGVVVVLAPEGKEEMEHELALQIPVRQRRGTKVVFRSGSPLLIGDLVKVSAHMAKAIVVLASGGEADHADADTLRCMLSLRSLQYEIQGHIVAEVRDIDNEPLVKLVGGPSVETLVSHDVLGRLMLMSARQPGLAKVYEALLGFDGDEFYMQEWPDLVGLEFGELMGRFPDAIPIGIRSALGIQIKPSRDRILAPGDEVVVIAEDNDTYKPEAPANIAKGSLPDMQEQKQATEKILFCGWRRDIRDIMQHLDHLAKSGTKVHMMTHCIPVWQRDEKLIEEGLDVNKLRNVKIIHEEGNTSVRRKLEALPIETFTSCMIFADQAFEADTMHADSHSLATLLLIRDIQAERGMQDKERVSGRRASRISRGSGGNDTLDFEEQTKACPIICEILDPRTQKTIAGNKQVSLSSDFCQSNRMIAQVVAMISEERSVKMLLDELLGVHGCNVCMYPASRYCHAGEQCSFWTLASRAAQMDEITIGYQEKHSIEKTVLNPRQKDLVMDWSNYDVAVIASEDPQEAKNIEEEAKARDGMQILDESWKKRERRSCLRESAREMSDHRHERSATKETAVSPHQVLLQSDEGSKELLTTLLDSCSGMNDGERARFGQALDMMKQLVWNVSGQR